MAKFIDSAEHRDRFPEKEVVLRLIKKEGKKKRRDGEVRKLGYNLNFKNTILALVYESCHLGDSMVLFADETSPLP